MQIVSPAPYLTIEERKELTQKNDIKALWGVIYHWSWIFVCFTLVYHFTNICTIILSLFIIGGRQLACAVLVHDAAHKAMFNNPTINDFMGNWFGGYPVFQDVYKYRDYHLIHHLNAGLAEDPDILLTRGYPTTQKSTIRKFIRDVTGQTGVKSLAGLVMMHLGYLDYNLGNKVKRISQKERSCSAFFKTFIKNFGGPLTV